MNVLKAKTPLEAWEKLIENFLKKKPEWFCEGVGYNLTNSLYTYDLAVEIEEAKFEPSFDFGKMFGYTRTKWTGLISNYLDLDVLDDVRDIVRDLEEKKTVNRNYHMGFHFADNHGNGKGCLVGGILSRKIGVDKPEITILLRTSEVVARLAVDMLLFCRMGEYIYGHSDFKLNLILKCAYADDTVILLYNNHKRIRKVLRKCDDEARKEKIESSFRRLKKSAEGTYKTYGHNLRAFKILRTDLNYKKPKPMAAGDLIIGDWEGIPLPPKCPSIMIRNQIKDKYLKFVNQYGLEMEAKVTKKRKLISFSTDDSDDSFEEIKESLEKEANEEA